MKIGTSMGLMVLVAALLMGTAAAGMTTEVTGDLSDTTYTISVLDTDIDFGSFAIGANTYTTTGSSFISVGTNYAITLEAAEDSGDGKMAVNTNVLTNPLNMGIGGFTPLAALEDMTASGSYVTVSNTFDDVDSDYDATFYQFITPTDAADNDYAITVTLAVASV